MVDLINIDCIEYMRSLPDKAFDLAIVDPPYGGGQHFNFRFGTGSEVYESLKPTKQYWEELFRVSKNQIVWGGNYFTNNLPENRCWICWNKNNPAPNFSDFELAWTSFDKVSKSINLTSYGFNHPDTKRGDTTIHPTQKPVFLYLELLRVYANKGDKILDTHLGSGSSAIAASKMGFDFVGMEVNKEYYEATCQRFKQQTSQKELF